MDFLPKSNWQWSFDEQKSLLTLQMGDVTFDIVYKLNMLVSPEQNQIPFTVEDVTRYTELLEHNALTHYQPEFACQIILHILAIELFHKPIMPKSWLFSVADVDNRHHIDLLSHVVLTAKGGHESAHYLVLEDEQDFVLCMLIDPVHQLSARKSLSQFQIVKVTSDKLNVVSPISENSWQSFQIASELV